MTALALAIVLGLGWAFVSLIAAGGFGVAAKARDRVSALRLDDSAGLDEEPAVAHG